MAISVAALLRLKEPHLHKAAEATSVGAHIRTTYKAVMEGGALVPIIAILVATAVLLQVILEFGPLWLVAMAAPTFLYGPHGAGLLSSFGIGGMLGGRVRPVDQLPATALVVGLMLMASIVLVEVHDSVVATIAQVVLASLLVALSIVFTRLLHDAIPSNVRAGVSSAVGSLTWMAFLPFALFFGAISKQLGIFDAGWLIVAATAALSVVLVRTALARKVAQAGDSRDSRVIVRGRELVKQ
jgi:hypothetical protein